MPPRDYIGSGSATQSGSWLGNLLANFRDWTGQGQNKDIMSYILDQLGSKIAPNNPFAGIGTRLAQGDVAQQQVQKQSGDLSEFIKQVIQGLTAKDSTGHSNVKLSLNDDGSLKYSVDGLADSNEFKGSPDTTEPVGDQSGDAIKELLKINPYGLLKAVPERQNQMNNTMKSLDNMWP